MQGSSTQNSSPSPVEKIISKIKEKTSNLQEVKAGNITIYEAMNKNKDGDYEEGCYSENGLLLKDIQEITKIHEVTQKGYGSEIFGFSLLEQGEQASEELRFDPESSLIFGFTQKCSMDIDKAAADLYKSYYYKTKEGKYVHHYLRDYSSGAPDLTKKLNQKNFQSHFKQIMQGSSTQNSSPSTVEKIISKIKDETSNLSEVKSGNITIYEAKNKNKDGDIEEGCYSESGLLLKDFQEITKIKEITRKGYGNEIFGFSLLEQGDKVSEELRFDPESSLIFGFAQLSSIDIDKAASDVYKSYYYKTKEGKYVHHNLNDESSGAPSLQVLEFQQ